MPYIVDKDFTINNYLCSQMRIVVNVRFLRNEYENSLGRFQYEALTRIVKKHPDHSFIFLFDKPVSNHFTFPDNVTSVYVKPEAKSPLSWKWWFDIKIPSILKKHKADVFVSMDGLLSMRTKIPQCLFVPDFSFIHAPLFLKKSHISFFKRNMLSFLKKATSIAVASHSLKEDIVTLYNIEAEKINITYTAATTFFQPLEEQKKEAVKDSYTNGYNYFLYAGFLERSSNLIALLKAFSIFKKRQKSSWKLVLSGRFNTEYKEEFLKSLGSYKYRDDVILWDNLNENERALLTGAAYAIVYTNHYDSFAIPVIEAMQCHTPVIVSPHPVVREVAGDAALYADVNDPADVADKMMQLYKDESLRSRLTEKGANKAAQYNWETTADLLWQAILKAAK